MNYKVIDLHAFEDSRGSLVALEKGQNCPFEVRRCFYIFDLKDSEVIRGAHANRRSEFLFVVVSGSCKVKIDSGKEQTEVTLSSPKQALYLDKMIWKEMYDFSEGAVLMVLSNLVYDETEYIRDYDEYINEVRGN